MEDCLYNLKMATKGLNRASKKCEKEEKAQKIKLMQAISKNNMEDAKINAENAIRQKNEGLNMLRISDQVEAISRRVQEGLMARNVTENMTRAITNMEAALTAFDLEKVVQMMDKKFFEDLGMQMEYTEGAMKGATNQFTFEDEVNQLLQRASDGVAPTEQDDLSQRLAGLRQT